MTTSAMRLNLVAFTAAGLLAVASGQNRAQHPLRRLVKAYPSTWLIEHAAALVRLHLEGMLQRGF